MGDNRQYDLTVTLGGSWQELRCSVKQEHPSSTSKDKPITPYAFERAHTLACLCMCVRERMFAYFYILVGSSPVSLTEIHLDPELIYLKM